MTQLKQANEPFGEVNIYPGRAGHVRVTATLLMEPHRPGTQTGIALDGSGSMGSLYGVQSGIAVSSIFKRESKPNSITPVAQQVCAYLARKLDADGSTTAIYWACGPAGSQVEEIGELTAEQAESHQFGPPKHLGTGTRLLPAVKYFLDRFPQVPWGFYVFLTDGELHDLDEVKTFSKQLARDIEAGRRNSVKLVLIGLGADVNEKQMEELDDLDTGTNVDLWDHKLAAELRVLSQIFAEVVDQNARVGSSGKIVDPTGKTIHDFGNRGVSASLEFEVPTGTPYFTLVMDGQQYHQGLSDGAQVPASDKAMSSPVVSATPTNPLENINSVSGVELELPSPESPATSKRPAPSQGQFEVLDDAVESTKKDYDAMDSVTDGGLDFNLETDGDTFGIDLKKDDESTN